ncbi:hypothetical protein Phpb_03052 [Photorhabdus namnaonensis]|uniref:Uncharacterized protein n=1 Tax=Photorhabdus namnaonensis TaxID=1851568 RepID=A0A1B8YFL4_9GAMM|nr:hypothetical protein Phpb_03052 [Photorhabdus namnaonensis]
MLSIVKSSQLVIYEVLRNVNVATYQQEILLTGSLSGVIVHLRGFETSTNTVKTNPVSVGFFMPIIQWTQCAATHRSRSGGRRIQHPVMGNKSAALFVLFRTSRHHYNSGNSKKTNRGVSNG